MSSTSSLAVRQAEALTVRGHPSAPLYDPDTQEVKQMITVCVDCGGVHSIIMLVGDRWYCSKCRAEGRVDRRNVKMFPIS
jgi:ribosomal protein S27AE